MHRFEGRSVLSDGTPYNHSELFVSTADGERALCHGSERGPPLSLNHYATGTLQNCLAKGARQWGTAKGELTGHHVRTDASCQSSHKAAMRRQVNDSIVARHANAIRRNRNRLFHTGSSLWRPVESAAELASNRSAMQFSNASAGGTLDATPCLYVHVHIPKAAGRAVYSHLHQLVRSRRVDGNTCYKTPATEAGRHQQVCCGSGTPEQLAFSRAYECGMCKFASAEWNYPSLRRMGLASASNKLLAFVRNPVSLTFSSVQHNLHSKSGTFGFQSFKEWAENMRAGNGGRWVEGRYERSTNASHRWTLIGYGAGDRQTLHLIGSTVRSHSPRPASFTAPNRQLCDWCAGICCHAHGNS